MKLRSTLLLSLLGLVSAGYCATLFDSDTFEVVDPGWAGGTRPTITTGSGYLGSSMFLRSVSSGPFGSGSHLALYNDGVKWNGDYTALGVGGIQGAFRNSGTTTIELRIVLFDLLGDRFTSSTPLVLAPGSGWVHHTFSTASSALTRVLGTGTYASLMSGVTRVMFRHDAGAPSSGGDILAGTLDLDNLQLTRAVSVVSGTALLSDFSLPMNGQKVIASSLDTGSNVLEQREVTLGTNGAFVFTTGMQGPGALRFKASHWLGHTVGVTFGTDPTPHVTLTNGDLDGDDEVGPGDFGLLSGAYGSVNGDPNWDANADLDGDGEVGPTDFGILSSNYGQTGD